MCGVWRMTTQADEPAGLDYSSPWHEDFVVNRHEIRHNLHILHPSMQTVLQMCQATLGDMLLVDCSGYRSVTHCSRLNSGYGRLLDIDQWPTTPDLTLDMGDYYI